ncbi:translocase [Thalassococcus sp. CAU 1522]|uniref:Translocase n=1 Tax=Thalassococcus arenae TaxID=2851652 RepID=A0ABS6N7J6_9RHOB|nr:translocase [Thalassococcus arenae]MBV2359642.1 translocase [Thalassococcus arenae]
MALLQNLKTYALAAGTLAVALGLGAYMQFSAAKPSDSAGQTNTPPLAVTSVTPTSTALAVPEMPAEQPALTDLPETPVATAASVDVPIEPSLPAQTQPQALACAVEMTAQATAGAQVDLSITAPCHGSERVTLHHNGMMVTDTMQPDGTLSLRIPALAEQAVFIAAFNDGEGAMATAEVSSLPFYDRVVLQWKGEAGLQLHAREFGADYFGEGHVWAASTGDLAATARGESGFLTRLGTSNAPEALLAEIYSFPAGTAQRVGEIAVSVEAEITAANCDTTVEAQTLELRGENGLRVHDLTLEMPGCDGVGDFLVLKNVVEDLKIASN